MIQPCNCRCCQFWEAEIANYIHKSLVEKEWVRKELYDKLAKIAIEKENYYQKQIAEFLKHEDELSRTI